jgi:ATP-dependent Clp protease ATP-binding subunit ClpC
VTERFLPDKAIDLIDEGSSRVRLYRASQPKDIREAYIELRNLRDRRNSALKDGRYDEAASIREDEEIVQRKLDQSRAVGSEVDESLQVTAEDIAEVLSMWTGIPMIQLTEEESSRLLDMENEIRERIVGQDEAIEAISKAVRRARAGMKDPKRPIGSFIFLGPTGVGKTELTKALARFLFGSEDALVQLDMSEFMERHNVARLIGSPPGYVGYEDAGQLTEAVRRRPYSIVVFDEIEKAHPEAFNILLQIMEEGHLSDAKGHKVDFRNAIIIMTSNVGADTIKRGENLGFAFQRDEAIEEEAAYGEMRKKLMEELKRMFRPEFVNRVDSIIVFRQLGHEHIRSIVDIILDEVNDRLVDHELTLKATLPAKDWLVTHGYDREFGARPLRRLIQTSIEDKLSDAVLAGRFGSGDVVLVNTDSEDADELILELGERPVIETVDEPDEFEEALPMI